MIERVTWIAENGDETTGELDVALLGALRSGYPMVGWPHPWTEVNQCTGVAASWCPVHGDCECPRDEDGGAWELNDPDCPLHSPESTHADLELRRLLAPST